MRPGRHDQGPRRKRNTADGRCRAEGDVARSPGMPGATRSWRCPRASGVKEDPSVSLYPTGLGHLPPQPPRQSLWAASRLSQVTPATSAKCLACPKQRPPPGHHRACVRGNWCPHWRWLLSPGPCHPRRALDPLAFPTLYAPHPWTRAEPPSPSRGYTHAASEQGRRGPEARSRRALCPAVLPSTVPALPVRPSDAPLPHPLGHNAPKGWASVVRGDLVLNGQFWAVESRAPPTLTPANPLLEPRLPVPTAWTLLVQMPPLRDTAEFH